MYTTFQKFTAEFLGTFALVFFGAGAICADRYLQSSGGIGLLGIALAHGLAMAIMVSALGHISGGHFNPAIRDRKSTRLNSSHQIISYAVFCLKKKKIQPTPRQVHTDDTLPEAMSAFAVSSPLY